VGLAPGGGGGKGMGRDLRWCQDGGELKIGVLGW